MGRLSRKKSRRIVVDGRPYRWILRGFHEPWPEEWMEPRPYPRSGTVTVQADCERPGRVCQFGVHGDDSDSITPGNVEQFIQEMVRSGWDPDEPGKPFNGGDHALADFPSKMDMVRGAMTS